MIPQFSVLMTNYNKGRYIDEAIRSVLAQTFTNWELIIVDDASTDDSLDHIERYLSDSRIRLYAKQKNEGVARSTIYGLAKASSGIVGILDSDDALVPDAIEKAHRIHTERPDLGLVLSQEIKCDSNLKPLDLDLVALSRTQRYYSEPLLWMRATTHFRTFKLAAYNKSAGLDKRLLSAEDWDLIFKLEEAAPAHRIDEPLYMYRRLSSSLSQGSESLHRSFCSQAFVLHKAYLRRRHQARFRQRRTSVANMPRPAVLAWIITAVDYSLDLREPWQAIFLAFRGLRIAPLDGAAWRAVIKSIGACMRLLASGSKLENVSDSAEFVRLRSYPVRILQSNTGNIEPDRVVCIPLLHKEGHCLFGGDYLVPESGRYKVTFKIALDAYPFSRDPLVVLDVYENLEIKAVLAERQIRSEDLTERSQSFSIEFCANEGQRVEFRVYWAAQCFLTAAEVILHKGTNRLK
jgi:glycosyltransferase involved in cell wall biosynthesis